MRGYRRTRTEIRSGGMADLPGSIGVLAMTDQRDGDEFLWATMATFHFSQSRVQRPSPSFSSTSWREGHKSFVFINIMESHKTDIFSTFVFINLGTLSPNFHPPFSP